MRRLVNSSALQSWKWQLIGMSWLYVGALCDLPLPAIEPAVQHDRYTIALISHTKKLSRSPETTTH